MKKLDKLIIKTFIGPFVLTFIVVVFILLLQYMLKYFDDLVGKGLGFEVFAELMTSFSIVMTPNALPLAVLLSSLMTFGNLGEHFELTAIKGAGISLLRAMAPMFYFTIGLVFFAFFSNNYIVPKAALNAYSLMYDVRQQKPALNIKEGAFYNGIQNFTIRVNEKDPEGDNLKDLVIYDHSKRKGNIDIIMADSGRMYSFHNDKYLVMELFSGHRYAQMEGSSSGKSYNRNDISPYVRTKFAKTKMLFSLEDFDLKKTKKELFANNRLMKNIEQLNTDIDSMDFELEEIDYKIFKNVQNYYSYHLEKRVDMPERLVEVGEKLDSIRRVKDSLSLYRDGSYVLPPKEERDKAALNKSKTTKKDIKKENHNITATTSIKTIPPKNEEPAKKEPTKKVNPKAKTTPKKNNKKAVKGKGTKAKPKTNRKRQDGNAAGFTNKTVAKKKKEKKRPKTIAEAILMTDSVMETKKNKNKVIASALTKARQMKNHLVTQENNAKNIGIENRKYKLEKNKKYALALACLSMFLIGAPLGAIIKKGGLGIPVIISIVFFILFYVININGEKLAKQDVIEPWVGAWAANFILFPIGLFFLRQARIDARLFDLDFYNVFVTNLKKRFSKPEKEAAIATNSPS